MGVENVPRFLLAAATAGGAAGTHLQVFEAARTLCHRAADVLIGNGLADANVHGRHYEEDYSTDAI